MLALLLLLLKYLILLPQVRYSGRMVKSGGRQLPPAVHSIISAALEPRAVLTLKINSQCRWFCSGSLCGRDCIVQACGCQRQMAQV
jgi:hypothetical protein